MKKLIAIIVVIILIVIAIVVFGKDLEIGNVLNEKQTIVTNNETENENTIKASYSDGTNTVSASYNNTNNTVTFSMNNTRENTLPVAMSGSGARYANEDETLVFWEHQNELTITKNGVEVFKGQKVENQ